ncbi:MAG: hypothetical protein K2J82_08080 [Muribaculaceae bacterium]|nr:hypothetical protein [Muribaculaceae bacterium]MDE6754554.1 hypothetical protein [Muribaculaceae bacterium]
MKKRLFSMMMLSLAVMLMGISFVACGDDKDEPNPNPPAPSHPEKIAIAYNLELGDGWWDFFDIEATYTAADGKIVTEKIVNTSLKGWAKVEIVKYEDIVSEYIFNVKATPKADMPQIDTNATYNFDKKAESFAYALDAAEKPESIIATTSSNSSLTIAGSNVEKYLSSSHENLGAGTITVKK